MLPPFFLDHSPLPSSSSQQKLRVVVALALTLAIIQLVSNRLAVTVALLATWGGLFFPLTVSELAVFAVAGVFFLIQNYATLSAGVFEFQHKDILLMPYYEPFLWGFYFTAAKRFIAGTTDEPVTFQWKAIAGLVITSFVFSFFAYDSRTLLVASLASTAVLFAMFHSERDVYYAGFLLALGLVIELFGVSTGLWRYPASDFQGIPYWFATMWISAGLLGRRFLFPVAQAIGRRLS